MRAGHLLDGYRVRASLPLAALGSALAIGLISSLWTAITLDLDLTAAAVIAILRRARRAGGWALREADGSACAPYWLSAFLVAGGLFVGALSTWVFFVPWDSPLEAACLCPRPTGLWDAAIDGMFVVTLAGMHTVALLAIIGASARLALGRHPQPPHSHG